VEPTCLTALMAAEKPTRETDRPTLTAGRTPELNKSVSKKDLSVGDGNNVGRNVGRNVAGLGLDDRQRVSDPPPLALLILAERSSSREWR